jgi:hypothetical protein
MSNNFKLRKKYTEKNKNKNNNLSCKNWMKEEMHRLKY